MCLCPPFLSSGAAFHFICDLPLHLHKWYYWVTHCIIHLEKKPFLIFQVIFLLTLYFDSLTLSHCGKLEFLGIFLAWVILNLFNWIILVYKLGYKILKLKSKSKILNKIVILELKWFFTTVWWYSSIIKLGSARRLEKWTPLNISSFLFRAGVGIAEKIANFPVCDTNGKGWLMLVYWEKAQICEIITDYSNVCKMGS